MSPSVPAGPGARLRQRRLEQQLGLRELARLVEIDAGHLSRIERGSAEASPALVLRLGRALGMPPAEVLPLVGKLPAGVEAELAGKRLADGVIEDERLGMTARRLLRRRALAVVAEREVPPAARTFNPSVELVRRGWRARKETISGGAAGSDPDEPGGLHVRFEEGEVVYRAGTQLEMRFLLAHALGHLLLEGETPECKYGIGNDPEVDASALAAFLLLPSRALQPAMFRAAAGADAWSELGGMVDTVALDLGAPPWAVVERASEEGLFSSIAEVPIS